MALTFLREIQLSSGDTWEAGLYPVAYVTASGNVSLTVNMDTPWPAELSFEQDETGSRTLTINGQSVTVEATGKTWVSLMMINGTLFIRGKATNASSGGAEAVTPDAPTSGVVDDTADTFDFTYNPSYTTVGDYEVTLDGGTTVSALTAKPISVGNVAKDAGQVGVRVKAGIGRNASAWLFSAQPFTVASGGAVDLNLSPYSNNAGIWTNTTGSSSGVYTGKKIPAGQSGRIYATVTDANSIYWYLTLHHDSAVNGATSQDAYVDIDDTYIWKPGGAITRASAGFSTGDKLGLYRDGTTGDIKVQRSADGTTWTDIATLPYNSTADLFICGYAHSNTQYHIDYPKGEGVV